MVGLAVSTTDPDAYRRSVAARESIGPSTHRTMPPTVPPPDDGPDTDEAPTSDLTASRRRLLRAAAGGLMLPVVATGDTETGGTPRASTTAPPEDATMADGNARFQVLTKTLIRLEYAPDG